MHSSNGAWMLRQRGCTHAETIMQKRSVYTERPTPPLVEKEATFLNRYVSVREQISWS
jgi:hypothetical protein